MKKVLVVYYTQTGQLGRALKATLQPLENSGTVQLYYESLKPKIPFPYPWSYLQFFDAFPECVQGNTCELHDFSYNPDIPYDLVLIAYQPWFLSLSIPVNSFLQSGAAADLLRNRKVISLLACRNMWLNAQEKMKLALQNLGAELVGNIAFVDKSSNLKSLVSVLAFALGGEQGRFLGIFPKYGVSDADLKDKAPEFGNLVLKHLNAGNYDTLQDELIRAGGVQIKSNLMLLEGRGKVLFPLYARYISKKGKAGSAERKNRVRIFGIVLPLAILILSPLITIISRTIPVFFPGKVKKETDYFSHNILRPKNSLKKQIS